MSDFDKEAEREKLREQFAEDERKRQNTQRMSELLLKGATMTDTHCDTCGDPIFRWDGQEFCPTCSADGEAQGEGAAAQSQQAQRPPEQQSDGTQGAQEVQGTTDGDADGTASNAQAQAQAQPPATDADPEPDPDVSPGTRAEAGEAGAPEPARQGADGETAADVGRPATGGTTATDRSAGSRPAAQGGLGAARESLVRTLTRFAGEAEETGNPADAREQLAAVEAAADALAALRRAER
jgi:uncharacterized Zn finger protein (UPF0148 family)